MTIPEGYVHLRDGTKCTERNVCRCKDCADHPDGPLWADERYSMGLYAGRMCDTAWEKSGYIDAGAEAFDPDYAGERYEADY